MLECSSTQDVVMVIDLSNDYSLAIHVKMTGQLLYVPGASPVNSSAPVSADKSASQAGSLSFASSRSLFSRSAPNGCPTC